MKDDVLEVLKNKYEALDLITINDLLKLETPEELNKLSLVLEELVQELKVHKTKKDKFILLENCKDLKAGKLSINKSGNGYLLLEDEDDLFININNLNSAVDGDTVLVEIVDYKGNKEGRVVRILKRDTKNIIGEIIVKNNKIMLDLDDDKKKITVELDAASTKNCVEGTKVVVNLIKEKSRNYYIGKVVEVIGHKDDPGVDIKSVAYKYEIYDTFSKESEKQTQDIPVMVDKSELEGRTDLTNEVIFTIDGDDTKDIDDAISIKKNSNTYTLGVHIADVSHYVTKDSPLDQDAFRKGTSSYLAYSVIPMLPHKLSNGICSLNPNVIRLTISCEMEIDLKGNIIKYDIFPSFIKSCKKMTYKKVNDILMRNEVAEDYQPYVEDLKNMNALAKILRKNKTNRGYIDFNIDEPKLICDENGKCIDVQRTIREDGEKLIEDFMIAANETVASHIYNMSLPFIYRVHAEPKQEKIDSFINFVNILGYKLNGKFKDIKPTHMQKLINQLEDKPERQVLSEMLLRCMQKAIYSKDNIGHFGLGSSCYTHFTSPIRRYPDLMVHRLLRTYLFENQINNDTIDYWNENLDYIALNSSNREEASVEAEREVDDMKMAEYMENHLGATYIGTITTITNFGMFVMLDNLVEGLIHINTLEGDYFSYIPEIYSLVGQRTKKRYRLGEKIKVKCISASKVAKTVDFVVLEGDKRGNKKSQSIL